MAPGPGNNSPRNVRDPLNRKVGRARYVMALEQIWPRLWLPAGLLGLFVLVSAFGLWPALPKWLHMGVIGLFALALLASFAPLVKIRLANRQQAIRWLEKKSGLPHRPATVLDDRLANSASGPSGALWRAHKRRAGEHVDRMKTGLPHPRTEHFDRWALRVPLVLALFATIGLASHRFAPGLAEAFEFDKSLTVNDLRIDAWVTPPSYTGTPPLMLVDGARTISAQNIAARSNDAKQAGDDAIRIPEMSELVVRISGQNTKGLKLIVKNPSPAPGKSVSTVSSKRPLKPLGKIIEKQDGAVRDLRTTLTRPQDAELFQNGNRVRSWKFAVTPDHPPAITLTKKPLASPRGSLRLAYRLADDYGVIAASAHVSKSTWRKDRFGKPVKSAPPSSSTAPDDLSLPLGKPPTFPLQLPKGSTKRGNASTYKDLTAHPWAGLQVEMVLTARDEAGKTGKSLVTKFKLPERKFDKPLARSVIAQRRSLAETPAGRRQVAQLLNQLTRRSVNANHPDMTPGVYLGLRSAYWRLLQSTKRKEIRTVVDQLWEVALTIEDGNLSKSERELRSAQDRLMDALAQNAPREEIARLMKELREALNKFMRAMAKNQQKQQQNADQKQTPGNQRTLTSRELDKMLRDIEKMAKSGARDAARQMLSQLRELLENLNSNQPQQSARGQKMRQQLDKLGEMIMKQRRLLDQTHQNAQKRSGERRQGQRQGQRQGRQQGQGRPQDQQHGRSPGQKQGRGQGQNRQGRQGQGPGSQRQQAGADRLQQRQGQLLDGLNELMDQMGRMGMQIPQDLMRAGSNMGQAEQRLGKRQLNSAGREQGKALENLRKGATELAEQMMRNGKRQGRQSGRQNRDPLGRARRTSGPEYGDDVKVPKEIDTRRARDILEELRRRLGQSTRPTEELDYLERLIEQF